MMRTEADALRIVRDFFEADKPVAAICHGPWLLAEADVVDGRLMTSWPSIRTDLRNAGAQVVDQEVVVDGRLITSRKPTTFPPSTRRCWRCSKPPDFRALPTHCPCGPPLLVFHTMKKEGLR